MCSKRYHDNKIKIILWIQTQRTSKIFWFNIHWIKQMIIIHMILDSSISVTNENKHWAVLCKTPYTRTTYQNTWMYNWKASYWFIQCLFKLYEKLLYLELSWKLSDWKLLYLPQLSKTSLNKILFKNWNFHTFIIYHDLEIHSAPLLNIITDISSSSSSSIINYCYCHYH